MLSDLRLTLRTLAKSPSFAFVAVFTLMLGIGVNTAMFSIVNGAIIRGLPFPDANRLVGVVGTSDAADQRGQGISLADFADLRARQTTLEDLAAYEDRTFNLSGPGGDPERIMGCLISGSGPALLQTPVQLGRWFRAEDDAVGAAPAVVLGDLVWRNRFKADPAVLGQQLKVNGEWATVIGVGPRNMRFPEESDAYMTFRRPADAEKRDRRNYNVFGRLKPGATIEMARAEFAAIGQRIAADHPDTNKNIGVLARPFKDNFVDDGTKQLLSVMLGAVLLVLLIACANVANLLLARAAIRDKEIAVRTALGATRGRLVRLLLTEAGVLSFAGAVLGLALAYGLMIVFNAAIVSKEPPYFMVFEIDRVAVLYVGVLAVASTLLAGVFPALRTSRPDLNSVLKDGGRGSTNFSLSRFTRLMVIGEVALSCVLLVLSGLMVRSVIKIQSAPLGFATAGIFTARVSLPEGEYKDQARQREFYRALLERVQARPEIAAASVASIQPTWNNSNAILIDGREPEPAGRRGPVASFNAVSPDYFRTLKIPFLQGRGFNDRDTADAELVAVVSSAFAAKFWPGQDAIGQRFRRDPKNAGGQPDGWITIVGIVAPTLQGQFDTDVPPQVYTPHLQQNGMFRMTLFTQVRAGDPAALAKVVRAEVRALDENLPIYFVQTLDAMVADAKFFKKLFAWIFGIFGGVALVLAGVGLYGVMAYSVSQRTQEIGVRMALGASSGDVLRLILRQGGWQLGLGLTVGLGLAFFGGKLLSNFLYNVNAGDPTTFGSTLLVLGTVGLAATLIPALRALRINPVEALRNE
ncbi:MAG: ABC transporter permease [Opitutae bacterium]|nr:ABC transporter permease [Opitutae bacterium]